MSALQISVTLRFVLKPNVHISKLGNWKGTYGLMSECDWCDKWNRN